MNELPWNAYLTDDIELWTMEMESGKKRLKAVASSEQFAVHCPTRTLFPTSPKDVDGS